jgi:hypothetical protein
MNAGLYGLVVYGVGCIIPTPIDQAQQTPNYSPVFVTEKVSPMFGLLGPLSQTQVIPLTIVASDANPSDDLQVRLFESINGTLVSTGQTTSLAYPSVRDPNPDNATQRFGGFEFALCGGRTAGLHLLYAVVADRKFVNPTSFTPDGGLSDSNHWDVSCM